MNQREYERIVETWGTDSQQARDAYRDFMITALEPHTESVARDDWGDAVVKLRERNDITTEEMLEFHEWLSTWEGVVARAKDRSLKISVW